MGSFPKAQTDDTAKVKHEAPKCSLFNNRLLSLSRLPRNSPRLWCVQGKNVDSSVGIFCYILDFNPWLFLGGFIFSCQKCRRLIRTPVKEIATFFFPKEATSATFVPQTQCFYDPAAVTSV